MPSKYEDLWATTMENRAREKYFLRTGRDFTKLAPTERRKLIEDEIEKATEVQITRRLEYDRESEGDFSLIPGSGRNNGSFDIKK